MMMMMMMIMIVVVMMMMCSANVVYLPSELLQTQTRWQCDGSHCVEEIEAELLPTETVA